MKNISWITVMTSVIVHSATEDNSMPERFNLIDEPWIPIAGGGRVSLMDVMTHPEYRALGGNPVQKIAVLKLLLAIAQATCTPEDDTAWKALGVAGLMRACCEYLARWHDRFYLYGEQPFLQMPGIVRAEIKSYGAVEPEIATGNTTVLLQSQIERPLPDADKALLLLEQMAFALSGKKADNSVVLSPGYAGKKNNKGKPSSAKAGSAVAHMGLLHNFWQGESLQITLWLNLLNAQDVQDCGFYPEGVGVAPWEVMPEGEDCPVARKLRDSLQGRLVPLGRFCLLTGQGLHYSEGITHRNYKEGAVDPSVAVNLSVKDPKVLWTDTQKRPWRELTALLSFFEQNSSRGFSCLQLQSWGRVRSAVQQFALWSGGLRVSSNAGEQYVSGSDDFVESVLWLHSDRLGCIWFSYLQCEMQELDQLAKTLYGCVMAYFKAQMCDGKKIAPEATNLFWQLCERKAQALVDACAPENETSRFALRHSFATYLRQTYDQFCPQETARQMDAWAQCRPNIKRYLSTNKGDVLE
jgi:CRISPR system Cascade subunit CasA